VPRAFVRCVVCGKDGEIDDAGPDGSAVRAPDGWIAFLAVYWPPGVALGPLVLRLCARCYLGILTAAPWTRPPAPEFPGVAA
jgi:hypothetical protein